MNYDASFSQAIPFGGSFSVSLGSNRNWANTRFQTINPRYQSTLSFSFSQPLLKDFGDQVSRKDILIARNNRDIAENDLKKLLIDTVSSVEQAYWYLVLYNESLNVQRQSLKLAEDLLANNRKKAEIGTLAPKEVISAQAEVASRPGGHSSSDAAGQEPNRRSESPDQPPPGPGHRRYRPRRFARLRQKRHHVGGRARDRVEEPARPPVVGARRLKIRS